ncbi:hypothetical protein PAEPH01_2748, partial [Pancytospora epiphaga]
SVILGSTQAALIDTGTGTSLIPHTLLKHTQKVRTTNSRIVGATWETIPLCGELTNVEATIFGKRLTLPHVLVSKIKVPVLIGASAIKEHPFLLFHCIDKLSHHHRSTHYSQKYQVPQAILNIMNETPKQNQSYTHSNTSPKDVDPRFKSLVDNYATTFQTEISELTLCNVGHHSIQTSTMDPIGSLCRRIQCTGYPTSMTRLIRT